MMVKNDLKTTMPSPIEKIRKCFNGIGISTVLIQTDALGISEDDFQLDLNMIGGNSWSYLSIHRIINN